MELPGIVAAPTAPLGSADATRRHALRFHDGGELFPGVTRPEAQCSAAAVAALGPRREDALIEIALPAILSEGAGPHLLDVSGALVLAVAPHPRLPGRVAMGAADGTVGPGSGPEIIGLVAPHAAGVWTWTVRAVVPREARVPALDALDAACDTADLVAWRAARS